MAQSRLFVSSRNSQNDQPIPGTTSWIESESNATSTTERIPRRPISRSIALAAACLIATCSLSMTGCCGLGGGGCGGVGCIDQIMERQVACMRDYVWAKRAFHLRFGHCQRVHAHDFRDGFVAGYTSVCKGGNGESPALPPEKYWSFRYRNQEGAEMQNAWFSGFSEGSQSAMHDGTSTFNDIQIAREVEQAMLAAQEIEDLNSGIERHTIIDVAPIVDESQVTESPSTQGIGRSSPISYGSNQPMPMEIFPANTPNAMESSSR